MQKFLKKTEGYILILSLLFMPVFIGFCLLIIDVARGNNTHSDLQAAADALALAGARELDGGVDAITRADAAMETIFNTVRFSGQNQPFGGETLEYSDGTGNDYTVIFLRTIPDSDDLPIDQAFINAQATDVGEIAKYVYVRARAPQDLASIFFNPATFLQETSPIAATAVATASTVICNLPPLYICNPLEDEFTAGVGGPDSYTLEASRNYLRAQIENGEFHGRVIKVNPSGNQTESPGNFGFLQVGPKAGANELKDFFAGVTNPTCYTSEGDTVTTEPGQMQGIAQAVNTRFGLYKGSFQDSIQPAYNTRKGYINDDCDGELTLAYADGLPVAMSYADNSDPLPDGTYVLGTAPAWEAGRTALAGFGADGAVTGNGVLDPGVTGGIEGAYYGHGGWDFYTYWQVNYGTDPWSQTIMHDLMCTGNTNYPGRDATDPDCGFIGSPTDATQYPDERRQLPSRWDVYRYEVNTIPSDVVAAGSLPTELQGQNARLYKYKRTTSSENANGALCSTAINENDPLPDPSGYDPRRDRRVINAVFIDCEEQEDKGRADLDINTVVSIFMVNPWEKNGSGVGNTPNNDSQIDIEVIDISGAGGLDVAEEPLIVEAYLVR